VLQESKRDRQLKDSKDGKEINERGREKG